MAERIESAADALLRARRTREWLTALPDGPPASDAEVYAIQDRVALVLGEVGGWKVGAANATSEPFRGPIQANTIFVNANRVPAQMLHVIGVEAELAYQFSRDLPPRDTPYTKEEVAEAIASIHSAIEVLDTRFAKPGVADPLSHRADHANGGVLVVGPALTAWRGIDPPNQAFRLLLNGAVQREGVGGNSAVDNMRLLVWMANKGARSQGGLRAGQIVTTGSCSGTDWVEPGTRVRAEFPGVGEVEVEIA